MRARITTRSVHCGHVITSRANALNFWGYLVSYPDFPQKGEAWVSSLVPRLPTERGSLGTRLVIVGPLASFTRLFLVLLTVHACAKLLWIFFP